MKIREDSVDISRSGFKEDENWMGRRPFIFPDGATIIIVTN